MTNTIKFLISALLLIFAVQTFAFTRGIYITESTALHTGKLTSLIAKAKKYNIDTFIIDVNRVSGKRFAENIKKVQDSGIHFVARIIIFPHGGTHAQVTDKAIWQKRLALAKYAVSLGAAAIQLDYIRYHAEVPPNPEKAKQILKVLEFFRSELKEQLIQMDIFGIAALKPANTIGQDVGLQAHMVDAFCPMVYPSHYEPFRKHALIPYETVLQSVQGLKKQLANHPKVAVYAYIETHNYRFPLTAAQKGVYIAAEIKAAHDAGADGWYFWSPNNHYGPLFSVLAQGKN